MAVRSTLIVAGRTSDALSREKLEKLLFHSLVSAFGDEAPGADAEFSNLTAVFSKPSREDEFGLTFSSRIENTPHVVRVQFNPTAEQFRAAFRESLAHALNATRVSESEPSTDGRVVVVYTGQVVAQTGEWLLADSALSGHQVLSWLDSNAAQLWWPQLQKFPNIGDKLTLHLFTPLAGPETTWSTPRTGCPQVLLSHVDVRMVQLTVNIDGNWRSNGKPVLSDHLQSASYEGIRAFVQLIMSQHQSTQTAMDSDGAPLGCSLSAPRPALYLFPGGGLGSPANALFSLQGFAMLFGGSFTSHRSPIWWTMVRNLSKLDAVVLPDWSPSNLLTYRFVSDLLRSGKDEGHLFGELILPPILTSTSNETTSDLLLSPPSTITGPNESAWAGNTLASDALPASTVLYFKLGWGELRLQPLAQRAGLVLLWASTVHQDTHASPLRILLPATQLTGATPVQGLSRLLKALTNVPQLGTHSSSVTPAIPGKSAHKPSSDSSSRSTGASKLTTTHPKPRSNVVPSIPPSKTPPSKSSTATARSTAERPSTARPLTTAPGLPKRIPSATESKAQQRPSTATVSKAPASAKIQSTKNTTRTSAKSTTPLLKSATPSSRPSGPAKPSAPSTADRLATHSDLVASKQAAAAAQTKARSKASPSLPAACPITSSMVPNGDVNSPIPEENTAVASTVSLISATVEASTPSDLPRHDTTERDQQSRDSLELAPMDPLMSGWRSVEQSQSSAAVEAPQMLEPSEQDAPPVSYPAATIQMIHPLQDYNEVYKVHKAEHLHEADESDVMDDTPLPSVADEFSSIKPTNQSLYFAESAANELPQSPLKPAALVGEESQLSAVHLSTREGEDLADDAHVSQDDTECHSNLSSFPPIPTDLSVTKVPELIDPAVTDSYSGGLHFTESAVSSSLPCHTPSEDLVLPEHLIDTEQSGLDYHPTEVNESVFPTETDSITMSCPPFGVGYEEVEGFSHTYDQPATEPASSLGPVDALSKPTSPDPAGYSFLGHQEAGSHEMSDQYAHAVPESSTRLIDGDPLYPLQSQASSFNTLQQSEPFYQGMNAYGDIKGDNTTHVDIFNEESLSSRMQPDTNLLPDVRDSFPERSLEPIDNEHEFDRPSAGEISDGHSSPVVTHGSDMDVNSPEHDARPMEGHITIISGGTELVGERSASPERQSSDISDVDANDHEVWGACTRGPCFADYAPDQIQSAFSDKEPVAAPVRDAQSAAPSAVIHEGGDLNDTREELVRSSPTDLHSPPDSSHDSIQWHHQPTCVSPDSLEELHSSDICAHLDHPAPVEVSADSTTCEHASRAYPVPDIPELPPHHLLTADSTTLDDDRRNSTEAENTPSDIPIGFGHLVVDATGDHPNDGFNLGSPTSEASVDSVVHAGKQDTELPSPGGFGEYMVTSSVPHGDHIDSGPLVGSLDEQHTDDDNYFDHEAHMNGRSELINGTHATEIGENCINGSPVYSDKNASPLLSTSPASKVRITPEMSAGVDILSAGNHEEHGVDPTVDPFGAQQLDRLADESPEQHVPAQFDPIQAWGQPQGLPAPVVPPTTNQVKQNGPNRPTMASKPKPSSVKHTAASLGKTTLPPAAPPALPSGPPVYLDVIWVPSYLVRVPHQMAVEFFNRVRSRTYILSGEALHPTIGEALIEGKALWGPQDVEILCRGNNSTETPASISILPTDEPYEWSCWLRTPCGRLDRETGESRLHSSGFHVLPAASLCDIEYSAGDAAFRCEGVRVDL